MRIQVIVKKLSFGLLVAAFASQSSCTLFSTKPEIHTDRPVITASVSPKANANAWHNSDVKVSFQCNDKISGISFCPEPVLISSEGANQIIQGTAVNNVGEKSTVKVRINIDKTPPNIIRHWPPSDAFGTDRSTVPVEGTLTDSLSGIDKVALLGPLGSSKLSSKKFSITALLQTKMKKGKRGRNNQFLLKATDRAGNTTTQKFRVVYTLSSTMTPSKLDETEIINDVPTSVNRALVRFGKGVARKQIHSIIESKGGRVGGMLLSTNTALGIFRTTNVNALNNVLGQLEEMKEVELALPVFFLNTNVFDNDLLPDEETSYGRYRAIAYDHIRLTAAANKINNENLAINPVTITIIDTGLDTTAGTNNELADIRYFDMCTPEGQLGQESTPQDPNSDAHGTRVAGIVAGANNGEGNNGVVRGINGAQFTVNVLQAGDCGYGIDSGLVNTSFDAVNLEVIGRTNVVSMSIGGAQAVDAQQWADLQNQTVTSLNSGLGPQVLWVFAAGNEEVQLDCNGNYYTFPASSSCVLDNVVSVGGHESRVVNTGAGGLDHSGRNLYNFGTAVTISAPGDLVWTVMPPGFTSRYGFMNGTSAATPLVGGASALLLSTRNFFPSTIKQLLADTAQQLNSAQAPVQGGLDVNALIEAGLLQPEQLGGNALQFDGLNDMVQIPHNGNLSLTQFTIEAWVRVDNNPNFIRRPFISKGANFGNYSLGVLGANTLATPGTVEYVQITTDGNYSMGGLVADIFDSWKHIAVTNSGSGDIKVYVNGNLRSTVTNAPMPLVNTEAILLGHEGFNFHKGLIDEVRIWNIVRTPEEIFANYNKIIDTTASGLVAYWNFDEILSDQTILDQAGSNNGTLGVSNAIEAADPVRVPSTVPLH